jgi:FkbM family methyltransferase
VMRRVLRPDSSCLDVGASTGALLRSMCELAPQGRHIAFEPRPDAAQQLRSEFPGVTVHAVALAAEAGKAPFTLVVSNPAYSGLKPRRYDRSEQLETITVPMHRLDDLVPADLSVAFVKIDVEGGEVGVLQGGIETLRRCQPIIAFEHGGGWTNEQYGTHSGMLYEVLRDAGLQISLLEDWLNQRPPLTPEAFIHSMHVDHEYFFLAHPAG